MSRRRAAGVVAIAFATLVLGLIAIGIVAAVALHQKHVAERERDVALSRQLALQSTNIVGTDPELALRLALSAVDTSPTTDAAAALRQATLAFRQVGVLHADSGTAETAAFSSDGSRVVTGGDNGIARVWDAASGREIAHLAAGHGNVLTARYSPERAAARARVRETARSFLTDESLEAGARSAAGARRRDRQRCVQPRRDAARRRSGRRHDSRARGGRQWSDSGPARTRRPGAGS